MSDSYIPLVRLCHHEPRPPPPWGDFVPPCPLPPTCYRKDGKHIFPYLFDCAPNDPTCDWGADRPPRPPALWASDRHQNPLCRFYENRSCYLRSWGVHLVLIDVAYSLSDAPNCARGIGGLTAPLAPLRYGLLMHCGWWFASCLLRRAGLHHHPKSFLPAIYGFVCY